MDGGESGEHEVQGEDEGLDREVRRFMFQIVPRRAELFVSKLR